MEFIEKIFPNSFDQNNHWYEKALNATIHPMVNHFFNLKKDQIINRYCHLNPKVNPKDLDEVLSYKPQYYHLSGSDLLHVTTENGNRKTIIIENNSCPSGQKSMPLLNEYDEQGGYKKFVKESILPLIKWKDGMHAGVIYDKNYMEASGYAYALADQLNQPVYLIPFIHNTKNSNIKIGESEISIRIKNGSWITLDLTFRYLTEKPWSRLPIKSKTKIINPVIVCLAGGRNKMMASKAYSFYNAELKEKNLSIITPKTIWDVSKNEIPLWIDHFGGKAVIKNPYSNAGMGVYTIVNQEELSAFMKKEFYYDKFIVQALIGNYDWSSTSDQGKYYHVGTIPNSKGFSYALDFRMMIHSTKEGYKPLSIYSRRAEKALESNLKSGTNSWEVLGTNLSFIDQNGKWNSETSRLLLMERKSFNTLGISLDNLVEGYIQTVLSSIAIDKMAKQLISSSGKLKRKLFTSLNEDRVLINEILL